MNSWSAGHKARELPTGFGRTVIAEVDEISCLGNHCQDVRRSRYSALRTEVTTSVSRPRAMWCVHLSDEPYRGNISIDATEPTIDCAATPSVVWPPNGQMIPFNVSVTVSDFAIRRGGIQAGSNLKQRTGSGAD
jgi:hypothetical protein